MLAAMLTGTLEGNEPPELLCWVTSWQKLRKKKKERKKGEMQKEKNKTKNKAVSKHFIQLPPASLTISDTDISISGPLLRTFFLSA